MRSSKRVLHRSLQRSVLDVTAASHLRALKNPKNASELPQQSHRQAISPRRTKRRPRLFSRQRAKLRRYYSNELMNQNLQVKSKPNLRTVLLRLKQDLVRAAIPTAVGQTKSSSMWWVKTSWKKKTRWRTEILTPRAPSTPAPLTQSSFEVSYN